MEMASIWYLFSKEIFSSDTWIFGTFNVHIAIVHCQPMSRDDGSKRFSKISACNSEVFC